MERLELLKKLSFGAQVAEEETNELASYFVETDQWNRIAKGEIDIVRGEKGSGKSAIYALLIEKAGSFFDNGTFIVGAENPRGATVFRDLVAEPPTSEPEFIVLWKLYVITIIAQQLREFGIKNSEALKVYKALEDAHMLEAEFSLTLLLRRVQAYAKKIFAIEALEGGLTLDQTTGMPNGLTGRIVLKEPVTELRQQGFVSVDNLFALMDEALVEYGYRIWVMLDRLDVAFIDNHDLEANALRALVRTYSDLRGLKSISLKIFLREDIWNRIMEKGFREATHLTKVAILEWNSPSLLNLIMRRLLSNKVLTDQYQIDATDVLRNFPKQEELFNRFFPKQVEQGERKATTFDWLVTRCRDGTKKTAPRELIYLLNCIREQEIRRLEQGNEPAPEDQLFDRSVFKQALPTVSQARLNQYLYAEYPTQREFLEKLYEQKTEQTPESLADLWGMTRSAAIAKAQELVDLGFFERRGEREAPTYWVPFLYRDALSLVQGKAESDDEEQPSLGY